MTVIREIDIEFKSKETKNTIEIAEILDYSKFGLPGEFFIHEDIAW